MVIHFLDEKSVSKIADFLMISRDQVYYWIRRYKSGGIDNLNNRSKSGRPSRINYPFLKQVLSQSPREQGIEMDYWNIYNIKEFIHRKMNVKIHNYYVYEILRKIGWKESNEARLVPLTQTAHRVTSDHLDMIRYISQKLDAPIERIITERGIKPVLRVIHSDRLSTVIEGETENGKLTIKYQEF